MIAFAGSTVTPPQATAGEKGRLKPITEESARFLRNYFGMYKNKPIRAEYSLRPNWRTTVKIAPDELVEAWRDENELVGVRPEGETNQLVLDIDPGSTHHPHLLAGKENWESIEEIRAVLLRLGIETKLFYSSERGGIHIRAFLPKMVNSLRLGAAVEYALRDAGYELKNGQLEVSPRIKAYSQAGETIKLHQAFRLPMQRGGSYIGIGHEVEERQDGLDQLVEVIKANIEEQDMTILEPAMEIAYGRLYVANEEKFSQVYVRGNALEFKKSMELRMIRGFDDQGQTNELMKEALKYGYIFLHLSGQELVNWLIETMETMPGYKQYCRHQHEMHRKAAAWQRWIERSHYYPYGSKNRSESKVKATAEGFNNGNEAKAASTQNKLKLVVKMVQKLYGTFQTAKEAIAHIRKVAAEKFTNMGTKFGGSTLNKPEYREIWAKLLERAARERSRTFAESQKISQKPDPQNQLPESNPADHAPCPIECLGAGETERPKASAVLPQLILGIMRVSATEKAQTVAVSEVVAPESNQEQPSQPEQNLESIGPVVSQSIASADGQAEILVNQAKSVQLTMQEIMLNANSPPSESLLFSAWMRTFATAKKAIDSMFAAEPYDPNVYHQAMLAERIRLFWIGVPVFWANAARDWFAEMKIDPGWPSGYEQ
jgi:hypothetical protein